MLQGCPQALSSQNLTQSYKPRDPMSRCRQPCQTQEVPHTPALRLLSQPPETDRSVAQVCTGRARGWTPGCVPTPLLPVFTHLLFSRGESRDFRSQMLDLVLTSRWGMLLPWKTLNILQSPACKSGPHYPRSEHSGQ